MGGRSWTLLSAAEVNGPRAVSSRIACGLSLLPGPGFGIPGVIGTIRFAEDNSVWMFTGPPTYGNGPFVDVGIPTTVPLLIGFVMVCAAEVFVGVVLLFRPRVGGWLSIALLPFELARSRSDRAAAYPRTPIDRRRRSSSSRAGWC